MNKITVLSLFGLVMQASAIVVEDYTVAEAAPSGLDWSFVYNYKNSSSVAVDAYWILTAKHVADDGGTGSLTIDGTVYTQQEIVYHDLADLALARYDKAFPGYYSLYTGDLLPQGEDPKLQVLMVGFGTMGSARNFSWTDNGLGKGTKRWGSQEIDRTDVRGYEVGGVPTLNTGFWMDFDLINTTYEAGTGEGDSGGGAFFNDGGVWKLAGINTQRSSIGGDYKATFAISMDDYADWITETIPEPVTTSMMGLGTFGLFLVRAGRRDKPAYRYFFRRVSRCDLFFIEEGKKSMWRFVLAYFTVQENRLKALGMPVWARASTWHKQLDRAFWNRMVVAHEHRIVRRQAFRTALKANALSRLDAFLARMMK